MCACTNRRLLVFDKLCYNRQDCFVTSLDLIFPQSFASSSSFFFCCFFFPSVSAFLSRRLIVVCSCTCAVSCDVILFLPATWSEIALWPDVEVNLSVHQSASVTGFTWKHLDTAGCNLRLL